MQKHFSILICCYNCQDWIEKSVQSALLQEYDNFEVLLVDAQSTDDTFNIIGNIKNLQPELKVFQNTERKVHVQNLKFLTLQSKPNSICVTLDGDDWLKHPQVLSRLNAIYNDNVWMTYGTYEEHPHRSVSHIYESYPDDVIENNSFRQYRWLGSHLRTYRRELFLKIKEEDFKDWDGNYFQNASDLTFQFPMLEMSGEHSKYISDILYVYNRTSTAATSHESSFDPHFDEKIVNFLKGKSKYTPLSSLDGDLSPDK